MFYKNYGAEEMAHWIKCLPGKCEGCTRLDSRTLVKAGYMWWLSVISVLRRQDRITGASYRFSKKLCFNKQKEKRLKKIRDDFWPPHEYTCVCTYLHPPLQTCLYNMHIYHIHIKMYLFKIFQIFFLSLSIGIFIHMCMFRLTCPCTHGNQRRTLCVLLYYFSALLY